MRQVGVGGSGRRRDRRKRKAPAGDGGTGRKLLEGEEVEVMFTEEGLKGSWNPGVVIGYERGIRIVQYYEFFDEVNKAPLVEYIVTSDAIDGLANKTTKRHRGIIRPLISHNAVEASKLCYSMCVDVLVEGAWWEGVIFDHNEGSSERQVFFPDLGDLQVAEVQRMRLTYDWDEVLGDWKMRGCWTLLQVLQELEKLEPFPISIREIWYDISCTAAFREEVGHWIFGSQSDWCGMASDIIEEALSTALGRSALQIDVDTSLVLENFRSQSEGFACLECADTPAAGAQLIGDQNEDSKAIVLSNNPLTKHVVGSLLQHCCDENSAHASVGDDKLSAVIISNTDKNRMPAAIISASIDTSILKQGSQIETWHPLNIEGEYCLEAIISGLKSNSVRNKIKIRKHVICLGWKIDYRLVIQATQEWKRYRYISPDGTFYYSLSQICRYLWAEQTAEVAEQTSIATNIDNDFPGVEAIASGNLKLNAPLNGVGTSNHLLHEVCLDEIQDYVNYMEFKNRNQATNISNDELKEKRDNAKKQLVLLGWTIWQKSKNGRKDLCYTSPGGKRYSSLFTVCKLSLKDAHNIQSSTSLAKETVIQKTIKSLSISRDRQSRDRICSSTLATCSIPKENILLPCDGTKKSSLSSERRRLGLRKSQKGVGKSHENKICNVLCSASFLRNSNGIKLLSDRETGSGMLKKRKSSPLTAECSNNLNNNVLKPTSCSGKRAQSVRKSSRSQCKSRCVLSFLIDNNVVSPRQKVQYLHKKTGSIMLEGKITRHGIKCNCCNELYTLSDFEAHAGSTNHRPAANLFLVDGRSLVECRREITDILNLKHKRIKTDNSTYQSDTVCSVCQEGGVLVLCDHCPSAFHIECLGLEDVPEGEWFCPSCRCSICGISNFNGDAAMFTEETKLYCDQCEREYHVGCLRNGVLKGVTSCPKGYWFCSEICSKIFYHLHELVGKSNLTSNGFSWTILKSISECEPKFEKLDTQTRAKHKSKLRIAIDVLHECFVTIVEPRTKRDLVSDIVFSKESELNRLNFWGFYTIFLEKGDEVISVATFRVYGDKVAEMPLIGTRIHHRRKGMCHILVKELEKLLSSLGVKRLLLPAVPGLLETWTTSFGFAKMPLSERLMLSQYTLLNFQGTTMCQKIFEPSIKAVNGSRENINESFKMVAMVSDKMKDS